MKIAIYTRVSTEDQVKEGTSLEVQEEFLLDYAKRNKLDVFNILQVCKGSIPRSRFLFHIVKYCYPRRYMDWVNIRAGTQLKDRDKGYSNDTLTSWASGGTYTRYLNELESMGVLKRNDIYVPGVVSKGIHLDWNYKPDDAVLYEGRSLDTFAGTVNLLFEPQEPQERGLLMPLTGFLGVSQNGVLINYYYRGFIFGLVFN